MQSTQEELPGDEHLRQFADRRKSASRRILISAPIAFFGELVTFGAMLVATDFFTHSPRGDEAFYVFVAGLIIAIPPALYAGYMVLRHWSVLRPIMILLGVLPWMPIPAVAIWMVSEGAL